MLKPSLYSGEVTDLSQKVKVEAERHERGKYLFSINHKRGIGVGTRIGCPLRLYVKPNWSWPTPHYGMDATLFDGNNPMAPKFYNLNRIYPRFCPICNAR